MATTTKIRLKLLVDEKTKKVLFAEAGKDFIDFLFGLLEIPLSSIIGLLVTDSGSLVNIYDSVQNFDPSYLQTNQKKESLLNPKPASSSTTSTHPVDNLLHLKQEYGSSSGKGEVGYVKEIVTYMVTDDLVVKPMSTISTITLLNEFGIRDVSSLKERTVEVDEIKAVELINALFEPNKVTVLTDVFIPKKTPPVAVG